MRLSQPVMSQGLNALHALVILEKTAKTVVVRVIILLPWHEGGRETQIGGPTLSTRHIVGCAQEDRRILAVYVVLVLARSPQLCPTHADVGQG